MSENPIREMLKPSRLYPLILVLMMFAWWHFYLKPMQTEQKNLKYQTDGYFKTKDKTDVWNAVFSPYKNTVKGICMGVVPYSIHYYDEENRNLKPQIDSLLAVFNATFSTYDKNSLISQFNQKHEVKVNTWVEDLHKRTEVIYRQTNGAFDPTVAPLVGFWGFGENKDRFTIRDSTIIDSLKSLVGYDKISLKDGFLRKENSKSMLDYGAVAKGYGVDVVADFLKSKGVESYMVEIGGEINVGTKKPNGETWKIAVEDIDTYERKGLIFIQLENMSMATSGSYRNFLTDSLTGEQYNHTIDPKVGFPAKNNLLSASIIHENCLEADALATALMVMGVDDAIAFAKKENYNICLIYAENSEFKTYYTDGFAKLISK